jgi:hypothetical protein
MSSEAPHPVEVVSEVGADRTSAYRRLATVALGEVEDLWGEDVVARPVRLLLPADAASFGELTGHAADVQDTPATTVGTGAEARVVVHPDAWDRLTPEGRQAVLTHELTHLAMQGDGPVPRWVGEGLAEYTAHRGTTLPLTEIAGSALDPVRAGTSPTTWPEPGAEGDRWRGYAMSWLACVFIAREHSEDQLVRLYHELERGSTLEEAVPEVLGVPEEQLRGEWREWLRDLVGGQPE